MPAPTTHPSTDLTTQPTPCPTPLKRIHSPHSTRTDLVRQPACSCGHRRSHNQLKDTERSRRSGAGSATSAGCRLSCCRTGGAWRGSRRQASADRSGRRPQQAVSALGLGWFRADLPRWIGPRGVLPPTHRPAPRRPDPPRPRPAPTPVWRAGGAGESGQLASVRKVPSQRWASCLTVAAGRTSWGACHSAISSGPSGRSATRTKTERA
jgi:hypothetical protein